MDYNLTFNGTGAAIDQSESNAEMMGAITPYPLETYASQEPSDGPYTDAVKLLGSIGQTARDVGIAVGTVKREIDQASTNYHQGRAIGENPNSAMSAWSLMTPAEKMMVILGVVGVAVAVWAAHKG